MHLPLPEFAMPIESAFGMVFAVALCPIFADDILQTHFLIGND